MVDVREFGARCDGVTDDTLALQAALERSGHIYLPAGVCVAGPLTIAERRLSGCGPASVLRFRPDATGALLTAGPRVVLCDLTLDGGDDTPKDAATAATADRTALAIHTQSDSRLSGLTIHGFEGDGIVSTDLTRDLAHHLVIDGVAIYNVYDGIVLGPAWAEYLRLANLYVHHCHVGLWMGSGNVQVASSTFIENGTNVHVQGGPTIPNHAHGIVSGCQLNHARTWNLYVDQVTNGQTFHGCHFYEAPICLHESAGVQITNGILCVSAVHIEGGGRNTIRGNFTPNSYAQTIVRVGADDTVFEDNVRADGTVWQ